MAQSILFYLLAGFIIYSAYFVVTAHNLFRSAVGLIAVLLGVAGLYLQLESPFLSAVQVTVYVGGLVVLVVYVILLVADVTQKSISRGAPWRRGVAGFLSLALFGVLTAVILVTDWGVSPELARRSASVEAIGRALLSPAAGGYVLPFEVISLVLVGVLLGALTIAGGGESAADASTGATPNPEAPPAAFPAPDPRPGAARPRPTPGPTTMGFES